MKFREYLKESHKDPFSKLPQDLTKLTKKQQKDVIAFFVTLPLKELRKRQDIVKKQQKDAYKQKNDLAMKNLQVKDNMLMNSIDKKEFG